MNGDRIALDDWIPVHAHWVGDQFQVEWAYLGRQRMCAPFFADIARACVRRPVNQLLCCETPIEWLQEQAQPGRTVKPSGFVFHMSRCGSTLVAKMLAGLPGAIVISEAEPIDAVLRAHIASPDLGPERQTEWLKWMIGVYGQVREGGERRLFVKFDCWHTLALPLIRRAFPSVPLIFLYRDPLEVLVSHMRQPGLHTIRSAMSEQLFEIEPLALPGEDFAARVLAKICKAALPHCVGPGALLVNYDELPGALSTTISHHIDAFPAAAAERDAIAKLASQDAKRPRFAFEPDGASKRAGAAPEVVAAARKCLGPVYGDLEALRRRKRSTAATARGVISVSTAEAG